MKMCFGSLRTALFHRLLQKVLRWVLVKFFLHFLLKFKSFDDFFPSKTWLETSLSVDSVCGCVCVCIHWIKTSLKLSLAFFSVPQMVGCLGWVAFEVSVRFTLKFKPFKMWQPLSLFILLPFLPPYRKGMCWLWIVTSKKYILYMYIFTWTVRKA